MVHVDVMHGGVHVGTCRSDARGGVHVGTCRCDDGGCMWVHVDVMHGGCMCVHVDVMMGGACGYM